MPGWHDFTLPFQNDGRLKILGLVQEQHGDRARLFMQWKQMNWPVMQDPLNALGVTAVPITVLIDEAGTVQAVNPSREAFLDFMSREPVPATPRTSVSAPDPTNLTNAVEQGDAMVLWGDEGQLGRALERYATVLEESPADGAIHFRNGVAFRKRYDSDQRQPGDFQAAVEAWTRALELDPNQYIWRRRIQQYGPRLDKPYAFYDWVPEAREAIARRGETPVPLRVEPGGAEFAQPSKQVESTGTFEEPDPTGRIHRDNGKFIATEVTVVPSPAKPGQAVRVHVRLTPIEERKAHWNNEAEALVFWAESPDGATIDRPLQQSTHPVTAVSTETRSIEFEVLVPETTENALRISAYALYYVCEDVNGTCLYRRADVPITIPVRR